MARRNKKPKDSAVRLKYYGLIWVTKRGYLIGTVVTAAILAIGLVAGYAAGVLPPLSTMWGEQWPAARLTPWPWLYSCLYWLILVGVIIEVFVTIRMLRRFAEKETEKRTPVPQDRD
jgi:hypothetical protein